VYGDAGNANFVSLDQLVSDAESGAFDYVLHVGDAGETQATAKQRQRHRCAPGSASRPVLASSKGDLAPYVIKRD
jgi:hypothetical protein